MRQRRRFTPEFKAQVVLDILTGRMSPAEASRRHGPGPNLPSLWKAAFLQRAHAALQADDHRSEGQARIAEPGRLVGQLAMEREILRKAPMLSAPTSPGSGRRP